MIEINPTRHQPIFEQIIAQIKMAVLKGLLKPGDSIPSVRKMALSLSVTPGTVAKAYGELERQQVIVTIRGKGAYIAETGKIQPSERQKEQGRQKLKEACVEMIYLGFSKKEILKMVEELYDDDFVKKGRAENVRGKTCDQIIYQRGNTCDRRYFISGGAGENTWFDRTKWFRKDDIDQVYHRNLVDR